MKKTITKIGVILFTSIVLLSCNDSSKSDKRKASQKEDYTTCYQCGKKIVKGQHARKTENISTGEIKWFCNEDCELLFKINHQ